MFSSKSSEISIIIPVYNCGDQIKTIVNSILSQKFQDFELIIVNDKSTDNTLDILKSLAKGDKRIKIINQLKNGGASTARNKGIQKSRGKYIIFFDADDNITPTTITKLYDTITSNNSELAVGGFTVQSYRGDNLINNVDVCTNQLPPQEPNEPWELYILKLLGLDGRLYQVWNKIYLSSIIKDNKIQFQPGINFGEDFIFNLNYLSHMTGKIQFILEPLYLYKQNLEGGTFSKSSLIYNNRLQNYYELEKFTSKIPDAIEKTSLLIWIKYNWIYSHLLAISLSTMDKSAKVKAVTEVRDKEVNLSFSNKNIIGGKRHQIEKILAFLLGHPRVAVSFMSINNHIKNSKLTAGVWRKLRSIINH